MATVEEDVRERVREVSGREGQTINDREFRLIVPKFDNSRQRIESDELKTIAEDMSEHFGGVTLYPDTAGCWLPEDGELMCDQNVIFTSVRDSEDVDSYADDERFMEALAEEVGDEFGQAAVFVSENVTEATFVPGEFKERLSGDKLDPDVFSQLL